MVSPIAVPIIDAICQGDPREMGFAQGVAGRDKIHLARSALADLEAFRLQQPRFLPYPVYCWIAGRKASQFLHAALATDYPAFSDRLTGLAAGANVRLATIHLFNALEPLLSAVGGCTACPGACSAVAVRGRRSATGEPMIVRNFDYLPLVQPFYILRESRPRIGRRSIEFTTAPLAGAVDGMNDAGLCITYNYGFTSDNPTTPAAPISMSITEALMHSTTVVEAAERIASRPSCGGGLLMLADATGDIASLELSATRSFLRRPIPGEDVLSHTNAFASPTMQKVQIPWDAMYTASAPTPLRGRRLHQSSEQRDSRFQKLLNDHDQFDMESLGAVMADHGSNGTPGDTTICVHGSYWNTTACLQFFPKSRRLRVAYDTACQARFTEFTL